MRGTTSQIQQGDSCAQLGEGLLMLRAFVEIVQLGSVASLLSSMSISDGVSHLWVN
jgi:hypothetical protein